MKELTKNVRNESGKLHNAGSGSIALPFSSSSSFVFLLFFLFRFVAACSERKKRKKGHAFIWSQMASSGGGKQQQNPSLKEAPPCSHFNAGKCVRGKDCRYLHEPRLVNFRVPSKSPITSIPFIFFPPTSQKKTQKINILAHLFRVGVKTFARAGFVTDEASVGTLTVKKM